MRDAALQHAAPITCIVILAYHIMGVPCYIFGLHPDISYNVGFSQFLIDLL
jgi:hypothetical protein